MASKKTTKVNDMFAEFKTMGDYQTKIAEQKKLIDGLQKTVNKLMKEIDFRDEKLKSLESMLSQNVPVILDNPNNSFDSVSPEEEIYEYQIDSLRNQAKSRDLTLEEARKLEIFVKNKRIAQEDRINNAKVVEPTDVDTEELLKIASGVDNEQGKDKS